MADYKNPCAEHGEERGCYACHRHDAWRPGRPGRDRGGCEAAGASTSSSATAGLTREIKTALDGLWPTLNPGGFYFIEDMQVGRDRYAMDADQATWPPVGGLLQLASSYHQPQSRKAATAPPAASDLSFIMLRTRRACWASVQGIARWCCYGARQTSLPLSQTPQSHRHLKPCRCGQRSRRPWRPSRTHGPTPDETEEHGGGRHLQTDGAAPSATIPFRRRCGCCPCRSGRYTQPRHRVRPLSVARFLHLGDGRRRLGVVVRRFRCAAAAFATATWAVRSSAASSSRRGRRSLRSRSVADGFGVWSASVQAEPATDCSFYRPPPPPTPSDDPH